MPFGVIYKITNRVNGKVYVGKTTSQLHVRWGEHLCRVKHSSTRYLHSAIRKHGRENFAIEAIDQADTEEELNSREIAWIAKLSTTDRTVGYNCTPGGEGAKHGPSSKCRQKGWRVISEATREKLRAANKGKKLSPEHVERMRSFLTGRPQSPEAIAKRSQANREVWKDPEKKAKQAEASRKRLEESGRKLWELRTPESLARAEETRKAWRQSPEGLALRQKISQIHQGKQNSNDIKKGWETRRLNADKLQVQADKISASKKAWWANPENRERMRITQASKKAV